MIKILILTASFWFGMLFPFVIGALGTHTSNATNKTAGTSYVTGTPATNASIGTVVIAILAKDNSSSGSDGDNGEVTSVADASGNTFTKLVEFTNTQGAALGGATISIWMCKVIATGSTAITFNFAATATAKVSVSYRFSVAAGNSLRLATTAQTAANDNASPSNLTISGLPSSEYLFIRAIAAETPGPITTGGPESGWTEVTASGTTGGSGVTNMSLAFEFRIVTTTGLTSTYASTLVASDVAQTLIALEEYTPFTATRRIYRIN